MVLVDAPLGAPASSCDPFPVGFCVFEDRVEGLSEHLDAKWLVAKELAKVGGSASARPRFCLAPIYQLYRGEDRAYSMYFRKENVVLIMLGVEEGKITVPLGSAGEIPFETCLIVHEMLHALTKAEDEEKVRAIWPCDDTGLSVRRR